MSKGFINLPDPSESKKKRTRKPAACSDCKTPLLVSTGWGSCESCHRGTSLPIGRIASTGRQKGKEVYLASTLLREASQDGMPDEAMEDLLEELQEKGYLVVWDLEKRMP